jgi:hypothetical protein
MTASTQDKASYAGPDGWNGILNDMHQLARTMRDWGRDCFCGYENPPNGKCGRRFDLPKQERNLGVDKTTQT